MFRLLSLILTWAAATLIAVSPAIVGADTGGILPWTRWAIAIGAMVALLLALPGILANPNASFRALSVPLCLFAFALIGLVQLLALPESIGKSLAPGSYQIYEDTANSISLSSQIDLTTIEVTPSISISRWFTQDATAFMVIVSLIALISTQVFQTRPRITLLLTCLALTGAVHAGLGIYQVTADPKANVWGIVNIYGGQPFGAFFNRNNASVILNLGLASGVGLIAWRMAAITGATLSASETGFATSEWLDVLFDRVAMIGVLSSLCAVAGLLACGSRGGIAGGIAGLVLAFGIVQTLHQGRGILPTLLAVAVIAGILLVQFEVPTRSIDRITEAKEAISSDEGLQEGRWGHWQDGLRTAFVQPVLGWGLGAYRYAYLPYQQTSGEGWFANADNLWLEWLVETGVVGCLLLFAVLVVIVRSLNLLNTSADPIDHGLATAGWFAFGSMAVSQAFDFGCRIPANAIMLAILSSAIVGRAASIGYLVQKPRQSGAAANVSKSPFWKSHSASVFRQVAAPVSLVVVISIAWWPAMNALEQNAHSDQLLRRARLLPSLPQFDELGTVDVVKAMQREYERSHDDFRLLVNQSRLTVDIARYDAARKAVASQPNAKPEAWLANYQALAPSVLRALWYSRASPNNSPVADASVQPTSQGQDAMTSQVGATSIAVSTTTLARSTMPPLLPFQPTDMGDADDDSIRVAKERQSFGAELHRARTLALHALAINPNADEIVRDVIRLDFAGGAPVQSHKLISRYITLRSRNSDSLLIAGRLAAQAEFWDLAASAWTSAMDLDPSTTARVHQELSNSSPLALFDIFPNDARVLAIAADRELGKAKPNTQLLVRAAQVIQRSLSSDSTERLKQMKLLARIHLKRGQQNLAAETLGKVIPLAPGDCEIRYLYSSALRSIGKLTEARQQARIGRQLAPADPRFEQILAAMLESENSLPEGDAAQPIKK